MFSEVFACPGGGGGVRYPWSHLPSGKFGIQGVGFLGGAGKVSQARG